MDRDREDIIERVGIILEETQTKCYAWALLPDHFHLLLEARVQSPSCILRLFYSWYLLVNGSERLLMEIFNSILLDTKRF